MNQINHRHHRGCSECSEARKERDALMDVGMGYGSTQALQLHRRQLQRLGMDWKAIQNALKVIHPPLMANLKLNAQGKIVPVDRRLYWERRLAWGKKAEVLRRKREKQEQHDRAYLEMLRRSRAEAKKMRRKRTR